VKKSWNKLRAEQFSREPESENKFGVRLDEAGMVVIDKPMRRMTKEEALFHAAYLVVLADDTEDAQPFIAALAKVQERRGLALRRAKR
jgi:hypothetical protein